MFLLYEYIKYWFRAKGLYGIHSPFITAFIKNVLKNFVDEGDQKILNEYRSMLINNETNIEITDFGAGSKKLKALRKVSKIYQVASSKKKYGRILYNLSKYYAKSNILELGTSLGYGTLHLKLGNRKAKIQSIEGCKATFEFTNQNFPERKNLILINNTFQNYFSLNSDSGILFDLVFVDGHHNGVYLKKYLHELDKLTHDETIIIIDDIRWSKSMYDAWSEIIISKKYHVTIDLFRMGLVCKKPNQYKEHFILKN